MAIIKGVLIIFHTVWIKFKSWFKKYPVQFKPWQIQMMLNQKKIYRKEEYEFRRVK